jgi:hypothetical protein
MSERLTAGEAEDVTYAAQGNGVRYWRQDFGDGRYLYFSRLVDGGLYVEIRDGLIVCEARTSDAGAASILDWLDRSRS